MNSPKTSNNPIDAIITNQRLDVLLSLCCYRQFLCYSPEICLKRNSGFCYFQSARVFPAADHHKGKSERERE